MSKDENRAKNPKNVGKCGQNCGQEMRLPGNMKNEKTEELHSSAFLFCKLSGDLTEQSVVFCGYLRN